MQKVIAIMGLLSIFGTGTATAVQDDKAAGKVCVLKVEKMACSACADRVEKEAKKIDGVKAAKVSQPKGTAEITYDPAKTSPEAIAKTISEKTGFKAEVPKS
ncbi:MAG: heavy-metal-associated domain-containing protein [Chthoniobacterales bacterium]